MFDLISSCIKDIGVFPGSGDKAQVIINGMVVNVSNGLRCSCNKLANKMNSSCTLLKGEVIGKATRLSNEVVPVLQLYQSPQVNHGASTFFIDLEQVSEDMGKLLTTLSSMPDLETIPSNECVLDEYGTPEFSPCAPLWAQVNLTDLELTPQAHDFFPSPLYDLLEEAAK